MEYSGNMLSSLDGGDPKTIEIIESNLRKQENNISEVGEK